MLRYFSKLLKQEDTTTASPSEETREQPPVSMLQRFQHDNATLDAEKMTEIKGGQRKSFSAAGFSWNSSFGELVKQ